VSKKSRDLDLWTVAGIAVVAFAIANIFHEGLGHGGACVLNGGHPLVLSSVHFECSIENRWIASGGTIANFILAVICLLALRAVRHSPRLRYFLWLSMTINLLQGGGYFLFSGVGNIGDWADVIKGLTPAWIYRVGLALLGAVTYISFVWLALAMIKPFTGMAQPERWQRAKTLTLLPYFVGGCLYTIAGLFNPVGMVLVAISAAAASFGGTSGLAWMWQVPRGKPPKDEPVPEPIERSRAWIIAGVVAVIIYIALLGPGIRFSRP
jgi:hypothetical protein